MRGKINYCENCHQVIFGCHGEAFVVDGVFTCVCKSILFTVKKFQPSAEASDFACRCKVKRNDGVDGECAPKQKKKQEQKGCGCSRIRPDYVCTECEAFGLWKKEGSGTQSACRYVPINTRDPEDVKAACEWLCGDNEERPEVSFGDFPPLPRRGSPRGAQSRQAGNSCEIPGFTDWAGKCARGSPIEIPVSFDSPQQRMFRALPWKSPGVAQHGTHGSGRFAMLLGQGRYVYGSTRKVELVGKVKPPWFRDYEATVRAWCEDAGMPSDDRQWEMAVVNWYYGGANISRHADDEPEIDQDFDIVSHSVGDVVDFCFTMRGVRKTWRIPTSSDKIIVMPRGAQKFGTHWTESKEAGMPQRRFNVTWRAYRRPAATPKDQRQQQQQALVVVDSKAKVSGRVSRPISEGGSSTGIVANRSTRDTSVGESSNDQREATNNNQRVREVAGARKRFATKSTQTDVVRLVDGGQRVQPELVDVVVVPEEPQEREGARYNQDAAVLGIVDSDSIKPRLPADWPLRLRTHLLNQTFGMLTGGSTALVMRKKAEEWFKQFDLHSDGLVDDEVLRVTTASVIANCHAANLGHVADTMEVVKQHRSQIAAANEWLKSSTFEVGAVPWWMGMAFVGSTVGLSVYIVHWRLNLVDQVFDFIWKPRSYLGLFRPRWPPSGVRLMAGMVGLGGVIERLACAPVQNSRIMSLAAMCGKEMALRSWLGAVPMEVPTVPLGARFIACASAGLVTMAGSLKLLSSFGPTKVTVMPPNSSARSNRV